MQQHVRKLLSGTVYLTNLLWNTLYEIGRQTQIYVPQSEKCSTLVMLVTSFSKERQLNDAAMLWKRDRVQEHTDDLHS